MPKFDKRKKQLEARLAELDERLTDIEDHLDETPDPDWEENAVEHGGDDVRDVSHELRSPLARQRVALELARDGDPAHVSAALDRIENGTYGVCVKCGEDISEERLDLIPHTPLCKDCARKA